MNKFILLFGILLVLFTGFVFFQFNSKLIKNSGQKTPSSSVTINQQTFKVEVAHTPQELMKGLSDKPFLPQNQGMLFIFNKPGMYAFWMRGMKFPLDILFINGNKIVTIYENLPPAPFNIQNPTCEDISCYQPSEPVDKVLEINAGLVKKYDIKKGDGIKINL